jgi:transcriptional regulator with XRE-family HTH domain
VEKKKPSKSKRLSLSEMVRKAISESGETLVSIADKTDISASQLSRFVRGERDLTLGSADEVCKVLGLSLVKDQPESEKPSA